MTTTGSLLDAIDELSHANRATRDPAIERDLVTLRHQAFDELAQSPPGPWPPPVPSVELEHREIVSVAPDALSIDALRAGVFGHGSLLVPGLLDAAQVGRLVEATDRALDGFDAFKETRATSEWFEPFKPTRGPRLAEGRHFLREAGSIMTIDSPRGLFEVLDVLRETGTLALVREHLGERPALAANKSTMRRAPGGTGSNWHQDGSFLGPDVRALNVWLCLSECGLDAPGLDLVPRRLDRIVATGTPGATFDWTVSPTLVEEVSAGTPVVRPIFHPGDALFFDHLFLHRTAEDAEMPYERHAIETWFFAPSNYPDNRVPLAV